MPAAYLPSPSSAVWHLGSIPVRADALCMVLGVLAGLWLTDRRYRGSGGRPGVILEVATMAVPVGLIGARLYSVLTNWGRYFGPGRDWTDLLRVWNGGMGVAGAVAAGALAAWAYCRRTGVDVGPVALAAAPALGVAQAISVWGNWFSQQLYGGPSSLPWAVAISPQHREAGYQAAATFQPLFGYESAADLVIALALGYLIRKGYLLSGRSAFALYAALWATAAAVIEALRVDYSPRLLGVRINLAGMLVIAAGALTYLVAQHRRRLKRPFAPADEAAEAPAILRARSAGATAGRIGLTGADGSADPPGAAPGPGPEG